MNIVVVGPVRGGVADVVSDVCEQLPRLSHRVKRLLVDESRGRPIRSAIRLCVANRRSLAAADVVHVEFGRPDVTCFWFALACRLLRLPLILVAHDAPAMVKSPFTGVIGRSSFAEKLERRVLDPLAGPLLRRLVASSPIPVGLLSSASLEAWPYGASGRLTRVPHGASPAVATLPPSRRSDVLFAGFLGRSKGLDVLLDSWATLQPVSEGTRLLVAGEPATAADDEWVSSLRSRYPETESVTWLGPVDQKKFISLFASAAIVVAPYRSSNPVSGVLVRAMVEGCAIVTTPVAAAVDALTDGESAVFVPIGDAAALADAISTLIADPSERDRIGSGAARVGEARHSWEGHVRALSELYDRGARR